MEFLDDELLEEARSLLSSKDKLPDSHLICECNCVSVRDIRDLLKGNKVELDSLRSELKLGGGCSSCINSFQNWKSGI